MESHNPTTKLGLGCVTFGREIDKETSFAMMDRARAMGIKSFDTAAVYGGGASETIIGEWLTARNLKGQVNIATKIIPPYTPENIRSSVDGCLTRLGLATIDLFYLHRWDEALNDIAAWTALDKLVKDGKLKALGISNVNAAQLANAINLLQKNGLTRLSYIQNNHNLAVSEVSDEMKKLCADNDIRIVTFSPLGAGFLTGKHLQGVQKNSRFEMVPGHQGIYFNDFAQKRLHKLMEVAARTSYTPALLAMAWAVHQPGIYSVLVGGRSVSQLELVSEAMNFYDPEIFAGLTSD